MAHHVLLIDFGSTDTKATLINLDQEEIIATTKTKTTVTSNLMNSFLQLKNDLLQFSNRDVIEEAEVLICSSAFGGFKMIAIGLTDSLTTDAAKRVALGAGTRIMKTFSYTLTDDNIEEINNDKPDIILLTGGTNGGNRDFIVNSATKLAHTSPEIPILIAGNEQVQHQVEEILTSRGNFFTSDNVMPKLNVLNPDKTRQLLRKIFFEKIIYAKGFGEIVKLTDQPIIPTPSAVLSAANLLSVGTEKQAGIGTLSVVDVGGATTDIHSVAHNISGLQEVIYEGLQEPFLKRTVEGDLGMRYSAKSVLETTGVNAFKNFLPHLSDQDIFDACAFREKNTEFIPKKAEDREFDYTIAKLAIANAMRRHVGHLRVEQRPNHNLYFQTGKDLRTIKYLIGTGGVLVHSEDPATLLKEALQTKPRELSPQNPTLMLDEDYLLSSLGLLGEKYPEHALRMLKTKVVKKAVRSEQ